MAPHNNPHGPFLIITETEYIYGCTINRYRTEQDFLDAASLFSQNPEVTIVFTSEIKRDIKLEPVEVITRFKIAGK
ncbi:hypothetical protein ACX0G7_09710 [Flavitalea antarctica]